MSAPRPVRANGPSGPGNSSPTSPGRSEPVDVVGVVDRIMVAGVALTTRALSQAMPGMDLTFPQWRALLVVGDSPDGATISEVANRVGVTLPATSRQLQRLARRGLVEIGRDQRDRRATRTRLTTGGQVIRDRILGFRQERISAAISDIGQSAVTNRELAEIADLLDVYR
jgi:MarR family transcriptional regulator, transcriptional regulator for hemolysin